MSSPPVRYFVFLEICDSDICELLNSLRAIFNQRSFKSGIHITLRGPYIKPISEERLADWHQKIRAHSILIANVGMFENDTENIVYLKVSTANNSRSLSKITRKFDFPKSKFDFNPHITLYVGDDKALAQKIYAFLHKEKIELVCHSYELSVHASTPQSELFPQPKPAVRGESGSLIFSRRVSPEILTRARRLISEHGSAQ